MFRSVSNNIFRNVLKSTHTNYRSLFTSSQITQFNGGKISFRAPSASSEGFSQQPQLQFTSNNNEFPFEKKNDRYKDNLQAPTVNWEKEHLTPIKKDIFESSKPRDEQLIKDFLKEHNINIHSDSPTPMPLNSFTEVPYQNRLVRRLTTNFQQPTPIQSIGWPIALSGRDMIGVSKTGSGKTLSFVLPAIQHIVSQPRKPAYYGPSVLIVSPTRELSVQIATESHPYLQDCGLRSAVVYGGDSKVNQIQALRRNPEFVVGTPGRILDHLQSGTLSLKNVSFLVLDEADRMLEMGFEQQVRDLFQSVRPDRQVLYWSATWPQKVQRLAYEFIKNPIHIQVGNQELTANSDITQQFSFVNTEPEKANKILEILSNIYGERPEAKVLIFTHTKHGADRLYEYLRSTGNARMDVIHGDKTQNRRQNIIDAFKANHLDILIATDVASRGLDIRTITDVINFSLPTNIESYVHRIGRTARAGAKGYSHSIISKTSNGDITLLPELIELLERSNVEIPSELYEYKPQQRFNNYGNNNNNNNYRGGRGGRGYGNNNNGNRYGSYNNQRRGPVSFTLSIGQYVQVQNTADTGIFYKMNFCLTQMDYSYNLYPGAQSATYVQNGQTLVWTTFWDTECNKHYLTFNIPIGQPFKSMNRLLTGIYTVVQTPQPPTHQTAVFNHYNNGCDFIRNIYYNPSGTTCFYNVASENWATITCNSAGTSYAYSEVCF
eukprot:gene5070-6310_t